MEGAGAQRGKYSVYGGLLLDRSGAFCPTERSRPTKTHLLTTINRGCAYFRQTTFDNISGALAPGLFVRREKGRFEPHQGIGDGMSAKECGDRPEIGLILQI